MLNLTGQIGSQVVVTFVREAVLAVSQERINGRKAYLSGDSARVVIGDRCRVTIVDERSKHGMYFVRVDEVVEYGDGISSLLEKTLLQVELGCKRGETNFEQKLISRLGAQCSGGAGDATMLEVLLDVLESYAVEAQHERATLNYGHYCIVISRLINKIYADDADKRVELYLRAARYCSANAGGSQWAESFRSVAGTLKKN